ncbi:hypothetical protein CGX12_11800 [Zobellella denitrificans]|nr:hypothetical protein CGX12_11800 [Zobellella denitrificans]
MNSSATPPAKKGLSKTQLDDASRLKAAYHARKKVLAEQGVKLTQEELAARCGWSGQSAVSQFMTGKTALSLEALLRLSKELAVSPADISPSLAAKLGLPEKMRPSAFSNVEPATLGTHQIPVLSYVQAGQLTEVLEIREVDGGLEYVQADDDIGERAFGMRISGDSMTPVFDEGDLVIIDPDIDPVPGDYVAAKNGSREATFKKYRPRGFNQDGVEYFELVPLNEDYAPIRSDMCPIAIIGTMVEHRKYRRKRR